MLTRFSTTSFFVFLVLTNLTAQADGFDGMMLSNGKLYTVVGVLLIIFAGIIIYLFNTDKKLKTIENQIKSNE